MNPHQHLISAATMQTLVDGLNKRGARFLNSEDDHNDAIVGQTLLEVANLIQRVIADEKMHYERMER